MIKTTSELRIAASKLADQKLSAESVFRLLKQSTNIPLFMTDKIIAAKSGAFGKEKILSLSKIDRKLVGD